MIKERYDIIASSLSSYFGVGFNTPQEQLDIDLGRIEKTFDDASEDRMRLGRHLEDSVMNYFEETMGIVIDERNTEYKFACNGLLKCKRDGRTYLDMVETGWENKISNSNSKDFVDDLGYHIQCQAYMMAFGLSQWVLSGLQNGKPVYRLISENKDLQADIEEVVTCVSSILMGIADFDSYPWHIVEKYSKMVQLKKLESSDLSENDKQILNELGNLKMQEKEIKNRIDELSTYVKGTFENSEYSDGTFKYVISTRTRKGDFDKEALSIEHPTIDINRYRKPDTTFVVLDVKEIKK